MLNTFVFDGLNLLATGEIVTRHGVEYQNTVKANGISKLLVEGKPGRSIAIFELKRHNLLFAMDRHDRNLVKALFNNDRVVVDAFEQIMCYLFNENVRWGILTTYQLSWAIEARSDGSILVSPGYEWYTSGSSSVLSMIWYVLHRARKDESEGNNKFPMDQFTLSSQSDDISKETNDTLGSNETND
jgi:hypothetical protein